MKVQCYFFIQELFSKFWSKWKVGTKRSCKKLKLVKFLGLFFFMDSLFAEAATCFLILHLNKSKLIYRSSHYIKIPKKLPEVSAYEKSSILDNLYIDHKFLRKCGQGEPFCRSSYFEWVLKMCEQLLRRPIFVNWYILAMSWRRLGDVLPTFGRRQCNLSGTS